MSRRDTIIISVLINSGLLAILFATAWNDDEGTVVPPLASAPQQAMATTAPAQPTARQGGDEVDAVLRRYSKTHEAVPSVERQPSSSEIESSNLLTVTVKRGDSLSKLAASNGTSVDELIRLNRLTSYELEVGQKIRLPKQEESRLVAAVESITSDPQYYTIQSGDNPWTIARKHGVPLKNLLQMNDLDDQKARRLKAGDKLRVR